MKELKNIEKLRKFWKSYAKFTRDFTRIWKVCGACR